MDEHITSTLLNKSNATLIKGEHHVGYDESNTCFRNVAELVRDKGGKAIFGWLVCEWGDGITARIHHCVWQKPDGVIVDVTPQFDPDLSKQAGEMLAVLREWNKFQPDGSATLVKGCSRAIQYQGTNASLTKVVDFMNRAETLYMVGRIDAANYYIEKADRARHKANGEKYTGRHTIRRFDYDVAFGVPLRPELLPFLEP